MPNWTKPFENATLSPHLSLLFFRLTFYRADLQRKHHQGSNLDRKSHVAARDEEGELVAPMPIIYVPSAHV